jgi:hypothetical protein
VCIAGGHDAMGASILAGTQRPQPALRKSVRERRASDEDGRKETDEERERDEERQRERERDGEGYVYTSIHTHTQIYGCMYVHTCYVLTKPPMPIYYVLAAVFASCFYVLKSLLHE